MADPRPLAVVTGGSRGIGRAFVLEATRRGYDVVFSYRSREKDAEETVELAAALGGQAQSVRADLEGLEGVHALASAARGRGRASWRATSRSTRSRPARGRPRCGSRSIPPCRHR